MSANMSLDDILIRQMTSTWQEAVQTAATPLIANKLITEEYTHQMIRNVDRLGLYIVLMPGFALVHASPGNLVFHTDISIATLREPIDFHDENGPASVVMCLACIDRTSRIEQLQVITEKLMKSSSIDRIAVCKDKEELFSLFRE